MQRDGLSQTQRSRRWVLLATLVAYLVTGVLLGLIGVQIPWANLLQSDLSAEESKYLLHAPHYEAKLIRTAAVDPRSNCHGWTFTNGERKLHALEVERLIACEFYCTTDDPQIGDVIVYRAANGDILHSGKVRAKGSGALIVIESKWGCYGRFLQPLDLLPDFCESYSFFRRIGGDDSDTLDAVDAE